MKMEFNQFNNLINEDKFFEAHEALEKLWFPIRKENSKTQKILRGFINSAVSFELVKRGRFDGAKRVWKNYEKSMKLVSNEDKYFYLYLRTSLLLENKKSKLFSF